MLVVACDRYIDGVYGVCVCVCVRVCVCVCAGAALVDVDKSDLDYIGIKALGHRKMLLAGIAEIKMDQSSAAATSTETVLHRPFVCPIPRPI